MKNLKFVVIALFALAFAVACDDDSSSNNTNNNTNPEICNNLIDDDGDGLVDCADLDCSSYAGCQTTNNTNNTNNTTNVEDCSNSVDDDGDGMVDCADSDCADDIACATNQCTLDNVFYDQADNLCDDGYYCSMNASYAAECIADANSAGGTFYGDCGTNGECPVGSICAGDGTTNMCYPLCSDTHTTCPGDGACIYGLTGSDTIYLCGLVESCTIVPNSCGTGEACYWISETATGCFTAGTNAVGDACSSPSDCPAETYCLGDGTTNTCMELCRIAEGDADCDAGTCTSIGDATYGACVVQ